MKKLHGKRGTWGHRVGGSSAMSCWAHFFHCPTKVPGMCMGTMEINLSQLDPVQDTQIGLTWSPVNPQNHLKKKYNAMLVFCRRGREEGRLYCLCFTVSGIQFRALHMQGRCILTALNGDGCKCYLVCSIVIDKSHLPASTLICHQSLLYSCLVLYLS